MTDSEAPQGPTGSPKSHGDEKTPDRTTGASADPPSPDAAMAQSQYNLPDPPRPGEPPKPGSRLGETAFIGCLYAVVGLVALALALMFGQIIWRMFFL